MTSFFTAIVLYAVGNDQLRGFGIALAVGLGHQLVHVALHDAVDFRLLAVQGLAAESEHVRLLHPAEHRLHGHSLLLVHRDRIILTIVGLGVLGTREKGFNVDFVGGTAYGGRLVDPVDIGTLRELVSEDRQKTRLKVSDAAEVPDPSGKARNTYEITYDDGQKTIVALANPPEGSSPEDRKKNVIDRASIIPDHSVEQIFPGGSAADVSTLFTIRTTEKERELVEASISRLFRADQTIAERLKKEAGTDLLAKNEITDVKPEGSDYVLTFKIPVVQIDDQDVVRAPVPGAAGRPTTWPRTCST